MSALSFSIGARDPKSRARSGRLTTQSGTIQTPAFVPVGTKAGVKGVLPSQLKDIGAQVVLANTYHLYLQPGEQIVKDAGGLARFMGWTEGGAASPGVAASARALPTMTDSGGFQVFSLGAAFGRNITKIAKGQEEARTEEERRVAEEEQQRMAVYDEGVASQHGQLAIIDDEGVTFTSHLDGSLHRFTPERSVEIQHALGADMFFAFDECTSPTEPFAYQREAMERTYRWAARSLIAHKQNLEAARSQALFGIIQGGRHPELRAESAKEIASLGFDGFGIGGSFSKEDMEGALQAAIPHLPEDKPRHFLGIGEPGDLLTGIAEGMDLFDCVAATRIGRHGSIYTRRGIIHLRGEKYRNDHGPLDPETIVPGTESFSRAYVSHQVRAGEMIGSTVCSLHNLGFILQLVDGARLALEQGAFAEYRKEFQDAYYA